MSSIKGLDNLLKKLDNLANVDTTEIVEECAQEAVEIVQGEAKKFSDEEYQYIDKSISTSKSGNVFCSVGLLNTKHDFEDYKGLYFQNYGFTLWKNGKYYYPHIGWFDGAIEQVSDKVMKDMKEKLKQEINNTMEG